MNHFGKIWAVVRRVFVGSPVDRAVGSKPTEIVGRKDAGGHPPQALEDTEVRKAVETLTESARGVGGGSSVFASTFFSKSAAWDADQCEAAIVRLESTTNAWAPVVRGYLKAKVAYDRRKLNRLADADVVAFARTGAVPYPRLPLGAGEPTRVGWVVVVRGEGWGYRASSYGCLTTWFHDGREMLWDLVGTLHGMEREEAAAMGWDYLLLNLPNGVSLQDRSFFGAILASYAVSELAGGMWDQSVLVTNAPKTASLDTDNYARKNIMGRPENLLDVQARYAKSKEWAEPDDVVRDMMMRITDDRLQRQSQGRGNVKRIVQMGFLGGLVTWVVKWCVKGIDRKASIKAIRNLRWWAAVDDWCERRPAWKASMAVGILVLLAAAGGIGVMVWNQYMDNRRSERDRVVEAEKDRTHANDTADAIAAFAQAQREGAVLGERYGSLERSKANEEDFIIASLNDIRTKAQTCNDLLMDGLNAINKIDVNNAVTSGRFETNLEALRSLKYSQEVSVKIRGVWALSMADHALWQYLANGGMEWLERSEWQKEIPGNLVKRVYYPHNRSVMYVHTREGEDEVLTMVNLDAKQPPKSFRIRSAEKEGIVGVERCLNRAREEVVCAWTSNQGETSYKQYDIGEDGVSMKCRVDVNTIRTWISCLPKTPIISDELRWCYNHEPAGCVAVYDRETGDLVIAEVPLRDHVADEGGTEVRVRTPVLETGVSSREWSKHVFSTAQSRDLAWGRVVKTADPGVWRVWLAFKGNELWTCRYSAISGGRGRIIDARMVMTAGAVENAQPFGYVRDRGMFPGWWMDQLPLVLPYKKMYYEDEFARMCVLGDDGEGVPTSCLANGNGFIGWANPHCYSISTASGGWFYNLGNSSVPVAYIRSSEWVMLGSGETVFVGAKVQGNGRHRVAALYGPKLLKKIQNVNEVHPDQGQDYNEYHMVGENGYVGVEKSDTGNGVVVSYKGARLNCMTDPLGYVGIDPDNGFVVVSGIGDETYHLFTTSTDTTGYKEHKLSGQGGYRIIRPTETVARINGVDICKMVRLLPRIPSYCCLGPKSIRLSAMMVLNDGDGDGGQFLFCSIAGPPNPFLGTKNIALGVAPDGIDCLIPAKKPVWVRIQYNKDWLRYELTDDGRVKISLP